MSPLARILDANSNRAREALRVMEDLARFVLNDEALCAELKAQRHGLRDALGSLPFDATQRLASRDTPGDVGADLKTAAEVDRPNLHAVASAAGARASEALRSLEEAAKASGAPDAARAFERARYAVYSLDQRLRTLLEPGLARQWRLCVLLTESLCIHHPWDRVAQLAFEGGADALQLREKNLDGGELVRRARVLLELAKPHGASVIINDRADVALAAGAHGVHLGQSDLAVAQVRAIAGRRLLIGVSTSNVDEARAAIRAGADYCGVGPMFPTTTKHKDVIVGPEYLKQYLADPITARVPHLAIGGIDAERASMLHRVGCRGIAVSSAVCGCSDPRGACVVFRQILPTS
jgi:thiamine-phosphate pyrophosphorylase